MLRVDTTGEETKSSKVKSLYKDPETPRPKTSRRVPSPTIQQYTDYIPSPTSKKRNDASSRYDSRDELKQKLLSIGSRIVGFLREEKGKSELVEWERTLVAIVSRNLVQREDVPDRLNESPPWMNTETYRKILHSVANKLWISPKGTVDNLIMFVFAHTYTHTFKTDAEEVAKIVSTWDDNQKQSIKIPSQDTEEIMFERLQKEFTIWIRKIGQKTVSREDLIQLSDLVLRLVGSDQRGDGRFAQNIRDRFLACAEDPSLDTILDTASQVVYEECMFRKVAGRVDESYRSEMTELRTQLENLETRRRDLLIQWNRDSERLQSGREKSSQFDAMGSAVWGSRRSPKRHQQRMELMLAQYKKGRTSPTGQLDATGSAVWGSRRSPKRHRQRVELMIAQYKGRLSPIPNSSRVTSRLRRNSTTIEN